LAPGRRRPSGKSGKTEEKEDAMTMSLDRDTSEIDLLLKALKTIFKSRGLFYQHVADAMGVSETTVKRYLTGHGLTVEILERLCRVADLRISDLVSAIREGGAELPPLTHADEEKLAQEPFLATLFYLIAKGHSPQSLQADFKLDDVEMNRYLTKLDRWGLIQLFPFNRIRMRVCPLFHVEKGGPLARSARQDSLSRMFSDFNLRADDWAFSIDKLSPSSVEKARLLQREFIDALAKIAEQDRDLSRESADYHGVFVLMKPIAIADEPHRQVAAASARAA
jgi:transcriptional regulator with XRE-family HTH domain